MFINVDKIVMPLGNAKVSDSYYEVNLYIHMLRGDHEHRPLVWIRINVYIILEFTYRRKQSYNSLQFNVLV
jgi:hypothetical protein